MYIIKGADPGPNSDDGYDNMAGGGYLTYISCWAFRNGYDVPLKGDGDGFKLGFTNKGDEAGVQRTLINCIASNNLLMGFDESMDIATSMNMTLYKLHCIFPMVMISDSGFSQPLGSGG